MLGAITAFVKSIVKKTPPIKKIIEQRDAAITRLANIQNELNDQVDDFEKIRLELIADIEEKDALLLQFGEGPPFVPNGHFYSPIPARNELLRDQNKIFGYVSGVVPGVQLNEAAQLRLLKILAGFYIDLPFQSSKVDNLRYFYENPAYSYSDAIFLNGIVRHVKPRRVIEIGSGYSSCMLLDTNEIWFDNSIECIFIEPYPQLLLSLLKDGDEERIQIHADRVQDVNESLFSKLERNDILFIDSTHVSKVGSDVNHILFNVLPSLAPGVYIHFHDVFYPFEYPKAWIDEGRAWTELYMLRAFLYENRDFEVIAFNTFLEHFHEEFFQNHMPLCLENKGGSIWLKKLG